MLQSNHTNKRTKEQKMSVIEIIENKIAHARNTAQGFDRLGMEDSSEMWWLVVGVLEGILIRAGEES
jgi:protein-arginine kinase